MTPEAQRLAEECKGLATLMIDYALGDKGFTPEILPLMQASKLRRADKLFAAIDQLASMIPAGGLAEEARDAARYRFLRIDTAVSAVPRVWMSNESAEPIKCLHGEEMDSDVDRGITLVEADRQRALSAPTPQQEQPR